MLLPVTWEFKYLFSTAILYEKDIAMATLTVRDMCATKSEQHAAIADALPAKPRLDKGLPTAQDSLSAQRWANYQQTLSTPKATLLA